MIDDIIDTAGTISWEHKFAGTWGKRCVCLLYGLVGEAIKRLEESPIKNCCDQHYTSKLEAQR